MRDPMQYEGRDLDHSERVTNGIETLVGFALIFVMTLAIIGSAIWAIHKAVVFAQGVFIR